MARLQVRRVASPGLGSVLEVPGVMAHSKMSIGEVRKFVLEQWLDFDSNGPNYNFPINGDLNDFFGSLYRRFVEASKALLGPFSISSNNSTTCWALCSHCDTAHLPFHDHTRTAHINSVYYLSLPTGGETEGGLLLRDDCGGVTRMATTEDSMLIFDPALPHAPERVTSSEFRISINMEILVEDPASIRRRFHNHSQVGCV